MMKLGNKDSKVNETILLVEDNGALRQMIAKALRTYGFRVLEAAHGHEARLIYEREKAPIHLILSNAPIPQIRGSVISEPLASIHPEIKVLYMSGYTQNFLVHQGVLNSEVNFIPKPFKVSTLVKKIRNVLGRSRQERLY
jgi:DNA-binding NtrC family response regulator